MSATRRVMAVGGDRALTMRPVDEVEPPPPARPLSLTELSRAAAATGGAPLLSQSLNFQPGALGGAGGYGGGAGRGFGYGGDGGLGAGGLSAGRDFQGTGGPSLARTGWQP